MSYHAQISQHQAIESLKRANCILVDALKNELARTRLNVDLLISLSLEYACTVWLRSYSLYIRYCYYRGLITVDNISGHQARELKPVPKNEEEKFAKLRYK